MESEMRSVETTVLFILITLRDSQICLLVCICCFYFSDFILIYSVSRMLKNMFVHSWSSVASHTAFFQNTTQTHISLWSIFSSPEIILCFFLPFPIFKLKTRNSDFVFRKFSSVPHSVCIGLYRAFGHLESHQLIIPP